MKTLSLPASLGWIAQLGRRMENLWALKLHGSLGMLGALFYGYFWTLRNPAAPACVMPLTLVDHWVTLVPWSIWVYFSLWPYVLLLPAPYIDLRQLLWYLWGTLLMSGGALTVFFLWPSTVPPSRWGERSNHPGFSLLEGVDACGNACPSLHVAFTVFTAYGFQILLSDTGSPLAVRILNILWSAGICFSTLTTGQHVFLDLVGGTLLGTVTAALVLRSEKTSQSAGP